MATVAGTRRVAALLLLLALASTAALATRDGAQVKTKPSPALKPDKSFVPAPTDKKPAKPYVPPATKPSPALKLDKPYVPPATKPSPALKPDKPFNPSPTGKKPAKPYVPPATKPGSGGAASGGGVGGVIPTIPGFGSIPGFDVPGMGGGWGGGFGGPSGGYSRGGVVASTTVCSEKGPCYKKKLTCPKKCYASYSSSGKGYGGGGGGGGCTVDCKTKCIAYC